MKHYYRIRKKVIWRLLDADGMELDWCYTKTQAENIRKDWEEDNISAK